jgi:hypothetical protein
MERLEEGRAERQRQAIRKAFEGIPEPPAPGTPLRVEMSTGIRITALELTPAEREGLSTGGVRIPASDDRIGLVDPADGVLKMYSRTEIRAKVKPRPPGVSFDDANGYAGTFARPLRPEVVTASRSQRLSTWAVSIAAGAGLVHALLYWLSR